MSEKEKVGQQKKEKEQHKYTAFLNKIEQIILQAMTDQTPSIFLVNSRKAAEGILRYLLIKRGKIKTVNNSDSLTLNDLKKLIPNTPYAFTYIQNYGNVAAHFDLSDIQYKDVIPCKIALSKVIHFFYEEQLKTKIPESILPHLMESASNAFETHYNNYSIIINDVWAVINSLKYDGNALPGKTMNLINSIFEFIIFEKEKKMPRHLLRNDRILDFNKTIDYLKNKNYLSSIQTTHFKHLISYAFNNLKKEKANNGEDIHAVYNVLIRVVEVFHKKYIGDLPEDLALVFNLNQQSSQKEMANKDQDILGWLIRSDDRQSMVYSLYEGKNTIGRQSIYRDQTDKIIINDSQISRMHASIDIQKGKKGNYQYCLRDEGPSKNGTFVNSPIFKLNQDDEVFLENGDIILLGKNLIQLTFKLVVPNNEDQSLTKH